VLDEGARDLGRKLFEDGAWGWADHVVGMAARIPFGLWFGYVEVGVL
jgi:hypothetical protein